MATFSYVPQSVYKQEIKYKTLITPYESGKEQRRKKWSAPLYKFHLVFRRISVSDSNGIEAFFKAREGAYDTFTWNNYFDSVDYTVRYVEDSLVIGYINVTTRFLECDFIQVK